MQRTCTNAYSNNPTVSHCTQAVQANSCMAREHGENRNTRLQQQPYRFTHKHSFFRNPVATEGRKRLRLGFTAIVRSKPWEKPAKIRARRKKHCRSPWTKIKRRTRTHFGVHGKPGLSLPLSNASLEPRLFHRSGKPHQKRKNAFTPSSPRTAAFRYDAPATPATAGSSGPILLRGTFSARPSVAPYFYRKRCKGSGTDHLGLSNRVPAVVRDRVHGVQLHGTAGGVSFLGPENPNSKAQQHKEEGN